MVTLACVSYYGHTSLGECVTSLVSIQYLGSTYTIYSSTKILNAFLGRLNCVESIEGTYK